MSSLIKQSNINKYSQSEILNIINNNIKLLSDSDLYNIVKYIKIDNYTIKNIFDELIKRGSSIIDIHYIKYYNNNTYITLKITEKYKMTYNFNQLINYED